MAAKAVIRDVNAGVSVRFVDRISKLVPPDPGMTLAKALKRNRTAGNLRGDEECQR